MKRKLGNMIKRKFFYVLFLILSYILAAHSVLWAASKVGAVGRIQAGNGLIYLTSASNDIIAEVLVQKDDVVEQGSPVAVLRSKTIYETEITLAKVELERVDKLGAEAIALQKLKIVELKKQGGQAIALQELQLKKEKEDQSIALKRFERLKRLGDHVSSQRRETGEYKFETARMNEEAAKQELAGLKAEQTTNLDIANRELQRLVLERSMNVKLAEQKLALAQERLRSAIILAPIDGTILKVFRQAGEVVRDDLPIIMMADLRNMFVIGEIFESDVLKIAPGMPVTITNYALRETLRGHVESIGRVLSPDSRVVEVKIRIEDPEVASRLINLEVSISIEWEPRQSVKTQ